MSSPEYPAGSAPLGPVPAYDQLQPPAQLHELRLNQPAPDQVQEWSQESQYQVVLRLGDGDSIAVGAFTDSASAEHHAREVMRYIAQMPAGEWPFFGGRYLRPELISSVDVIEGRAMKWSGSESRLQWGPGS